MVRKRRIWKASELISLLSEYPSTPTSVLAEKHKTSVGMIHFLTSKFGIKKNRDYRTAVARQNALLRYGKHI